MTTIEIPVWKNVNKGDNLYVTATVKFIFPTLLKVDGIRLIEKVFIDNADLLKCVAVDRLGVEYQGELVTNE